MGRHCIDRSYWSNYHCEYHSEYIHMTLTELAEQYGESIDNLPMDVLMEGIYNEWNASDARVLHGHESTEKKE